MLHLQRGAASIFRWAIRQTPGIVFNQCLHLLVTKTAKQQRPAQCARLLLIMRFDFIMCERRNYWMQT